ncbi:MAG: MFS transporter, partial [Chloroflexia bacterium]|nr:MFS transporter [Chloroflexia bacterium]
MSGERSPAGPGATMMPARHTRLPGSRSDRQDAERDRLPLIALLVANVVSLLGTSLTTVALPWFVLQSTGSAGKTGLVAAAALLPAFAAGIFGGALVDRLGYRRVSILSDLISGLSIAMIPLLYQTVGLAFWQLLVLVFVGAVLDIPGLTARRSLLPELASAANWRLERANSLFESSQHVAFLIGPPLAGLLIGWRGPVDVLWLDAASFAVSGALVAALVTVPIAVVATGSKGYLRDLAAGLRFLRQHRLLLNLALTLTASNMLSAPFFSVLLPVYADATFGRATPLGLMFAAMGAGSLAGALTFGAIGHRLPRRWLWLIAFLAAPVEIWLLALSPPLPVLLAGFLIVGLVTGPTNPLLVTIRHERIPPAMRGRVFGTFSALAMAAQPIGVFLGGAMVE